MKTMPLLRYPSAIERGTFWQYPSLAFKNSHVGGSSGGRPRYTRINLISPGLISHAVNRFVNSATAQSTIAESRLSSFVVSAYLTSARVIMKKQSTDKRSRNPNQRYGSEAS